MLETEYYDLNIRTCHGYENVIIDEVDSMILDNGSNMLFLPHEIPQLNQIEHLLRQIWSFVQNLNFIGEPEDI